MGAMRLTGITYTAMRILVFCLIAMLLSLVSLWSLTIGTTAIPLSDALRAVIELVREI